MGSSLLPPKAPKTSFKKEKEKSLPLPKKETPKLVRKKHKSTICKKKDHKTAAEAPKAAFTSHHDDISTEGAGQQVTEVISPLEFEK